METFYQIVKLLFVFFFGFTQFYTPVPDAGDLISTGKTVPGNTEQFIQINADDRGFDIWKPHSRNGGYRYGPSIILNADGSLDIWCASNGSGDIVDIVNYRRLYNGGTKGTKEKAALMPTPESHDSKWVCDPGVIKFGGYYYIGYTTTLDGRGVDNDVCVARSKSPDGPFNEKWTGSGWGAKPLPLIEYTDNPECFGAGEPSFVLMDKTLYIYYSWANDEGVSTRVATADITDENWPANLTYRGECIPPKNSGDSSDVKYIDEYGRFVAVFTEKRFSDDSYIAVWESFDGVAFRESGYIKANTAKKLHNCGISGRSDGHISINDPVYISYAYGGAGDGEWGNWATRMHKVTLSLSDSPKTDDALEKNSDSVVERQNSNILPDILTIKAEKQVYNIKNSEHIWILAYDSDGIYFPLLYGMSFDGYDKSVINIVGTTIYAVGTGSTCVNVHWHGFSGQFVVHTAE